MCVQYSPACLCLYCTEGCVCVCVCVCMLDHRDRADGVCHLAALLFKVEYVLMCVYVCVFIFLHCVCVCVCVQRGIQRRLFTFQSVVVTLPWFCFLRWNAVIFILIIISF